ncbi:MAG: SDR family oxidoreductase [Candidatus Eisenbacteria sp.]|nr:SDR family oxidoreductase [Candidatus Eisenbacteria bacterium]
MSPQTDRADADKTDAAGVNWSSQTVLITGAARRLGRALAAALAARGARLLLHYHRSGGETHSLARSLESNGASVTLLQADLRHPEEQERLAAQAIAADPPPTGLVNNASLYERSPLDDWSRQVWEDHLAINLTAPVWLAVRLGRDMQARGGGNIVQIGDWSSRRPYPHYLAYTVSKGGLETATRALARELAPQVRVNLLALGPMLLPEESGPERERLVRRAVPLGRLGGTEAYVAAVLSLLDPRTYATGSVVTLDGGRSLT